jgi:hypothetical protein
VYPSTPGRSGDEFRIKNPAVLAIAFVSVMTAHDAVSGQAPTSDKALDHLRCVVQFFWAAHTKLIPLLCYTLVSHDLRISAWATALRTAHIIPVNLNKQSGMGP